MASITSQQVAPGSFRARAKIGALRQPHREFFCGAALLAVDGLAMAFAAGLVSHLTPLVSRWFYPEAYAPHGAVPHAALIPVLLTVVCYLAARGRYRERRPFWDETRIVVTASCAGIVVALAMALASGDARQVGPVVAVLLAYPVLAAMLSPLAKRVLARLGVWPIPVLLIGDGANADTAEAALDSDLSLGLRVVARIEPGVIIAGADPVRLRPLLARYCADRVLVALEGDDARQQVVGAALREGVPFTLVPDHSALPVSACEPIRPLGYNVSLLSFREPGSRRLARGVKAALDVSAAALLLVLTSPVFLLVAICNRFDGGPVFFAHRRVGAQARPFRCLKFRTMVVDGDRVLEEALARDPALEAEWLATRKLVNDPRVTPVGRFLRTTSLDELPQLVNVLRLEMSLVGPRPIVESEVPLYGENIERYYATRPGLTGLWQVSGRSTTSYERRVELDVWYVNNWSIWHDIVVLLKTIPAVISRQGAV